MRRIKKLLFLFLAIAIFVLGSSITAFANENDVCSVDGVGYTDFAAAIEEAATGATVTLEKSFTVDTRSNIQIVDKKITLDLAGYTLTSTVDASNYHFITVGNGGSLIVKDSSPEETGCLKIAPATGDNGFGIHLKSGSSFTMQSGTIDVTRTAVDISTYATGITVDIRGGTIRSARYVMIVRGSDNQVNISDGLLESNGAEGHPVIYLTADDKTAVVDITGGELCSTQTGAGSVISGYNSGVLNFGGDAKITATDTQGITIEDAIEVNITGGEIHVANTEHSGRATAVSVAGNSKMDISRGKITSTEGAALEVEGDAVVDIKAGEFISETSGYNAKAAVIVDGNAEVTIEGGTFTDNTEDGSVVVKESASATVTIRGGSFSSKPDDSLLDADMQFGETEDGNFVAGTAVAEIDGKTYVLLDQAIAEVQPGETILLRADVELEDDTGLQIIGKGTIESPITLNLNGFDITGANSQGGNTTSAKSGIIKLSASHVLLTDNSPRDEKGAIINTSTSTGATSTVLVIDGSTLTIDGGLKIETKGSSNACALQTKGATVTVENAVIEGFGGHAIKQLSYEIGDLGPNEYVLTINGGIFSSSGKDANISVFSGSSSRPNIVINGGSFLNWLYYDNDKVGEDKAVHITGPGVSGGFKVEVADAAPLDYTARIKDTNVYLIEGNIYDLRLSSTQDNIWNGKTLEIIKDATFTFPEGKSFGISYGAPYTLTLDLAEDVTLSGGMTLKIATITVTGAGALAEDFAWTAASEDYEVIADATNRIYRGQIPAGKAAAQLTLADGTTTYFYTKLSNAVVGANNNPGSTLKLLQDASTGGRIALSKSYTVDLNGKTWDVNGYLEVRATGDVRFINSNKDQGGTLDGTDTAEFVLNIRGGSVTIGEDVTVIGNTILLANADNGKLTVYGTIDTTGTQNTPIMGNGNGRSENTVITIKEGAKIIADADLGVAAIYHPQDGTLNIEGGEISGATGIYMKAGVLNMTGGVVKGSGEAVDYTYSGDGYTSTGDAIVLDACGYPGGAPAAEIKNGKVASENGQPVSCYLQEGFLDIEDKQFISGGSFSGDVSQYIEDNYSGLATGVGEYPFLVGAYSDETAQEAMDNTLVAKLQVNNATVYYTSLEEAVGAAAENATITLLANTEEAISLDKALVIRKNGYAATGISAASGYDLLTTEDSYIVIAEPTGGATYTVKYYLENVEQFDDTETNVAPDALGAALAKAYDDYYLLRVEGPDEEATYHVYYARNVYSVTVQIHGRGTASAEPSLAVAGTEIELTADAGVRYRFVEWKVISGAVNIRADGKFIMPRENVVVRAIFELRDSVDVGDDDESADTEYYRVDFHVNGGSGIDSVSFAEDAVVDLSDYTPVREGYRFTGWYADEELTERITEIRLTDDVTIYAGWENLALNPFVDVNATDWFYSAVLYAYGNDLMNGMDAVTFAPQTPTTRGMIVTILYRMENEPAVTAENPFVDVLSGKYYYDAVVWAAQNLLADGYGDGTFAPEKAITRQELAAFFYRYAQYKGMSAVTLEENLGGFSDNAQVSEYAVSAMNWAIGSGLMQGKGNALLDPQGQATRAEIAQVLMNFFEIVME